MKTALRNQMRITKLNFFHFHFMVFDMMIFVVFSTEITQVISFSWHEGFIWNNFLLLTLATWRQKHACTWSNIILVKAFFLIFKVKILLIKLPKLHRNSYKLQKLASNKPIQTGQYTITQLVHFRICKGWAQNFYISVHFKWWGIQILRTAFI